MNLGEVLRFFKTLTTKKTKMKIQSLLNIISMTGIVSGMIFFLLNRVSLGLILIFISLLLLPAIRLLRKFEKNKLDKWDYFAASLQWISFILIPLSLEYPIFWIVFIVFFSLSMFVISKQTKLIL